MKYTTNYNFKKPELTDSVNIGDINDSFDLIDGKLKETQSDAKNDSIHFAEEILDISTLTDTDNKIYSYKLQKSSQGYMQIAYEEVV